MCSVPPASRRRIDCRSTTASPLESMKLTAERSRTTRSSAATLSSAALSVSAEAMSSSHERSLPRPRPHSRRRRTERRVTPQNVSRPSPIANMIFSSRHQRKADSLGGPNP
jgi:hypothetical protein